MFNVSPKASKLLRESLDASQWARSGVGQSKVAILRNSAIIRTAWARLNSRWTRLPRKARWVLKLHGCVLGTAVLATALVSNLVVHQGYELVAFAVPAAEDSPQPWRSEVDAFGNKVANAFGVPASTANEFAGWILEASERQQLEPELLASLVLTESSFRKNVRSAVGAVGPAQIRPEYWSGFCGISDLYDPAENIYCGAQVLSYLVDRCGGEGCALGAYNIGYYSEREQAARRYVAKVDRYRDHLRNFPL